MIWLDKVLMIFAGANERVYFHFFHFSNVALKESINNYLIHVARLLLLLLWFLKSITGRFDGVTRRSEYLACDLSSLDSQFWQQALETAQVLFLS